MIEQDLLYSGRPIEKSHLEIAATFESSGTRPIEKSPEFLLPEYLMADSKKINQHPLVEIKQISSSKKQIISTDSKIIKQYPFVESHLEIAATFESSGTRPIEKSPEFLLPEYLMADSKIIDKHPLVEIRHVSSSKK
ncbi:MAG: hypothetical protein AAFY63_00105 [Cyanobacteria bacterium J06643_13]